MKNKSMKRIFLLLVVIAFLISGNKASISQTIIGPTEDPMNIGIGARPMGMGRAFVGLADDTSAIFMNPAGLARTKALSFLTMYTNLMNEIPYKTLGVSTPFNIGGFEGGLGIGYIGSGVSGIPSPSQAGFSYFDYHNDLYILSAAGKLTDYMLLGASLKVFDEGFKGSFNASGKGKDLDVGMLIIPVEWFSLGLTASNVLPSSAGATLKWDSGAEESIPCNVKAGAALSLFDKKLKLAFDAEKWVSRNIPTLYHAGVEYMIHPMLVLRAGIDQTVSAASDNMIASNPTFGAGLKIGTASIDYAYHTYSEGSNNATHYVSICLAAFSPKQADALKGVDASKGPATAPAVSALEASKPAAQVKTSAAALRAARNAALKQQLAQANAAARAKLAQARLAQARKNLTVAKPAAPIGFTPLQIFGSIAGLSLLGLVGFRRILINRSALKQKGPKVPKMPV